MYKGRKTDTLYPVFRFSFMVYFHFCVVRIHKKMCQMFDLSLSLLVPLLSTWLSLKNVTVLDSAICSNAIRERYHKVITHDGFILSASFTIDSNSIKSIILCQKQKAENWVILRKIAIDSIRFRNK